ncbi:MAG: 50S ribosomal protein L24, partial [Clostridia bacterium]|nr:50S ribosomal protein L24 [Clostridia bacterium]
VMRVCSKCGKAARTGVRVLADGSKVRYCKKCDAEISD